MKRKRMKNRPKGFLLYRIWYGKELVYVGKTKRPLRKQINGHVFSQYTYVDIEKVTKIEYAGLSSEADMNVYEMYYINLWKPRLNEEHKTEDFLSIQLPDLTWNPYLPEEWESWKAEFW